MRGNLPSHFLPGHFLGRPGLYLIFIWLGSLKPSGLSVYHCFYYLMLFYCKMFHLLCWFRRCYLWLLFWAGARCVWIFPCSKNGATNTDISGAYLNLKKKYLCVKFALILCHSCVKCLEWIMSEFSFTCLILKLGSHWRNRA